MEGVCIVSSIYPPDIGGPATFTREFANWLYQRNQKVQVITYASEKSKGENIGFPVTKVYLSKILLFRFFRMLFVLFWAGKKFKTFLATGAFIETYLITLFSRKRFVAKIPGDIVWERARNNGVTNLGIEEFQFSKLPTRYAIFRKLFLKSIRKADIVIVPSQFLHNLVRNWGVPDSRIHIIYNSISNNFFDTEKRTNLEYDVLTVARLVPWKGVSEIIEVCSVLGLKLCVVGNGPEMDSLTLMAKNTGADVTFLGQIDHSAMRNIYGKAKLFVLNSSYEGLPHVLVEARACGLFSMARSGTGSAEVISPGIDGYLYGGDNNISLEDALISAIQDSDFRMKAIESGISDCRIRFNQEVAFGKIQELLI